MKKWPVIEEKINKFLIWFITIVKTYILKLVPPKVKSAFKLSIQKTNQYNINQVSKLKNKLKSIFKKVISIKITFVVFIRDIVKSIINKVNFIKQVRLKDLNPQYAFVVIKKWIKEKAIAPESRVGYYYKKIGSRNLLIMSIMFIISSVTLTQIYSQSKKILVSSGVIRAPASSQEVQNYPKLRPKYYKQNEKQLYIRSLRVPVYIGTKSSTKSLTMDLIVVTSNKYIRAFLNNNHYMISDALNSKVEPIIPSFPLEAEGKVIIKATIKKELNLLIRKLKIKGEIESVHIHAITAG